jgi:Ca2+:H+ antiporter
MTIFRNLLTFKSVALAWVVWLMGVLWPGADRLASSSPLVSGVAGVILFALTLGCVFHVVRQADVLAELLGEPYGTLVLTLSATAIEAALLLSVMLAGEQNPTLLRDTVFATLMVALNGLVGLALTAGGWRHVEQAFNLRGALAFLHIIAPLSLLILVLPNYTQAAAEASLSPVQEAFLGVLCVLVYGVFLRLQVGRHRAHFDHVAAGDPLPKDEQHGQLEPSSSALYSAMALVMALLPIVLLSERLAVRLEFVIESLGLPAALGGLVVTGLVLAPEGMSAFRAALENRVQRAINLCLGSALSTIALTIPTVLIAAALLRHSLILGVSPLNMTLLYASLLVAVITLVSGRANLLQGTVHLMIFAAYLFFMFYP